MEIAVLGAGLNGLSAALALARRGHRVAVLEQFHRGNRRGSSHGDARVFRLSYDDPRLVQLADSALTGWRQLERERSLSLLRDCGGGLDLGPTARWEPNARALTEADVKFEVLSAEDLRRRFPGLQVRDEEFGLWQSDAGWLAADQALEAMSSALLLLGGELVENFPVDSISESDASVHLAGESGTHDCDLLVVAGGAWNRDLALQLDPDLAPVHASLRPTQQTVAHFRTEARPPAVIDHTSDPEFYFLPASDGLVKAALHGAGRALQRLDGRRPEADPATVAQIQSLLSSRLTGPVDLQRAETCVYTNTPDQSFVIDRRGAVVLMSCCSGHAFKFGPALGNLVADVAEGASPPPWLGIDRPQLFDWKEQPVV